jgi:hypothetical protein
MEKITKSSVREPCNIFLSSTAEARKKSIKGPVDGILIRNHPMKQSLITLYQHSNP